MDLRSISKVVETNDADEANEFLDEGWLLLGSVSGVIRDSEMDRPFTKYTLGFPSRTIHDN